MKGPLKHIGDNEYEFVSAEGIRTVWIGVDNISVYIQKTDEGVIVDLFPKGDEFDNCLASTGITFEEATPDE